jgi:hypothetical protein
MGRGERHRPGEVIARLVVDDTVRVAAGRGEVVLGFVELEVVLVLDLGRTEEA